MGHLVARKGGKAYHWLYAYSLVGLCDSGTSCSKEGREGISYVIYILTSGTVGQWDIL